MLHLAQELVTFGAVLCCCGRMLGCSRAVLGCCKGMLGTCRGVLNFCGAAFAIWALIKSAKAYRCSTAFRMWLSKAS